MWIVTEKGDARNLSMAYKIEFAEYRGVFSVWATFPAFAEYSTLRTFDNIDDAKKFVSELVNKLNNENHSSD